MLLHLQSVQCCRQRGQQQHSGKLHVAANDDDGSDDAARCCSSAEHASLPRAPKARARRITLQALDSFMVGRLDDMRGTFDELTARLADPDVLDDPDKMLQISKQRADAEEVVNAYEEYQNLEEELSGATEMFQEADDQEMRELAREEVKDLEERIKATEDRLALLLIPKDPMDEKNVMLEIRAGTGGGEAAIWAGDLVEAYTRYAKTQGWQTRASWMRRRATTAATGSTRWR